MPRQYDKNQDIDPHFTLDNTLDRLDDQHTTSARTGSSRYNIHHSQKTAKEQCDQVITADFILLLDRHIDFVPPMVMRLDSNFRIQRLVHWFPLLSTRRIDYQMNEPLHGNPGGQSP